MRERLDCAVLATVCSESWVTPLLGDHAGGRLQVRALDAAVHIGDDDSLRVLGDAAMRLRRYDACLIPVSESNLAWARTCLSAAQGALHTPVIAVVRGLKAAALNDLHALGVVDFLRAPACTEELRARLERLLDGRRYAPQQAAPGMAMLRAETPLPALARSSTDCAISASLSGSQAAGASCANHLQPSGMELEAFAVASASRCATTKESFRTAKSQVIERFERAYITAALGRHSGNIAMAARAAQKHRRAFWALMRKHEIDAAPFRLDAGPNKSIEG